MYDLGTCDDCMRRCVSPPSEAALSVRRTDTEGYLSFIDRDFKVFTFQAFYRTVLFVQQLKQTSTCRRIFIQPRPGRRCAE